MERREGEGCSQVSVEGVEDGRSCSVVGCVQVGRAVGQGQERCAHLCGGPAG